MEEYVKQIRTISGEIWLVFKGAMASWKPEDEKWWEELISLADNAIIKYKGTIYYGYAKDYANIVMNEIERKSKREKNEKETAGQ